MRAIFLFLSGNKITLINFCLSPALNPVAIQNKIKEKGYFMIIAVFSDPKIANVSIVDLN